MVCFCVITLKTNIEILYVMSKLNKMLFMDLSRIDDEVEAEC